MSRRLDQVRRCTGGALVAAVLAAGMSVTAQKPVVDPLRAGPLPAPKVRVNKTTPKVAPPRTTLSFSARPTAAEIFAARVFKEPIVPVGGQPGEQETAALAQTLVSYTQGPNAGSVEPFRSFLAAHPATPWRSSIQLNLGTRYRAAGAWGRALEAWENAWTLAKDGDDPHARAVADLAMGEWLLLNAQLGRAAAVRERAAELSARRMGGPAAVKVGEAREISAITTRHPDKVVSSGPQALLTVLEQLKVRAPAALTNFQPTSAGVSLLQLRDLSRGSAAPMRMVRRVSGTDVPVPSIVHWKVNHYAAIVEQQGEQFRIVDRGMGGTYWLTRELLLEEASGYFLVPDQSGAALIAAGSWSEVADASAAEIVGFSCPPGGPPPNECNDCCPAAGGGSGGGGDGGGGGCTGSECAGMVRYQFHAVTASLRLLDTPVGYAPPRGPDVYFRLTYHQRDALQPQIFSSSHVGPKWMTDWFRYLQEEPADVFGINPPHVWVLLAGGGREVATGPTGGAYPASARSKATIVKVSESPLRYERRLHDGTVEVFGAPDSAPAGQRRVYLTEIIDPQQQSVTLTWDSQRRLIAITDAIDQVTTLVYGDAADPLRLTGVTDPFARTATLTYNAAGQLESITDVLGMVSRMAYASEDFVSALTTPYGTTTFRREHLDEFVNRFVEATDPLGGTERVEFRWQTDAIAATEASSEVPSGFSAHNADLDDFNTVYWDKLAWSRAAGDVTAATITRWVVVSELPAMAAYSTGVPHSVKRALESRLWYAYANQPSPGSAGSWSLPTAVGRVLDDGTSQVSYKTYNPQGSVLTRTDPLGRQTTYTYASNGIDVLTVRQTSGSLNHLLASYTDYVDHHPQTITDGAGQTTTFTYNSAGQVLSITNAKGETTTNAYDGDGRLESVTGPVSAATTTHTSDAYGRVRTITDADNATITFDYDALDRPIRTTYPDSTYEETVYARLDAVLRRDRLGRVTRLYHDAVGRVVGTRDALGRLLEQEWCTCGTLEALRDGNGNRTRWERDVRGRVTREVRADGVTDTLYGYGSRSGRLLTTTDPKDQVTTYTYALDDQLLSAVVTNAATTTPAVTITYDPNYRRLATVTDGTGTTTYTYHQPGVLGAGRLASVDGPLSQDTITYGYDELGRTATRAVDGTANAVTWAFDTLGRLTTEVNRLGTFTYGYDGPTDRIASVTYPNGQTSTFTYLPTSQDNRLETIHHKYPGGTTLSKFDYTYDLVGNISTWRQQSGTTASLWEYRYDGGDQLTSAVKRSTLTPSTVLQRFGYAYDGAGNRTAEQVDDVVTGASHDAMNRLLSHQPAGPLVFAGTVSEPATVTVQGIPAVVGGDNAFRTTVPVTSTGNTVTISAADASGNVATRQYQVDNSGASRSFTYDLNGNTTSDGVRTYEWDGRNQLTAIVEGTSRLEFVYDAWRRRVRAIERVSGAVQSERAYIWAGEDLVEERIASSGAFKRFFPGGIESNAATEFVTTDHLGSVRDITGANAALLTHADYDPFGRRQTTVGQAASGGHFQGYYGLTDDMLLTQYRAFATDTGRWLSEDPIRWLAGPNFTAFADNNPVNRTDPSGLCTLKSSTVLFSLPGISRVQRDAWRYKGSSGSPQTPESPIPDIGGTVVYCMWSRWVIETRPWKRFILDTYACIDPGCVRLVYKRRLRTENYETKNLIEEIGWKTTYIPIIIDTWINPDWQCVRAGKPPY